MLFIKLYSLTVPSVSVDIVTVFYTLNLITDFVHLKLRLHVSDGSACEVFSLLENSIHLFITDRNSFKNNRAITIKKLFSN